MFRKHFDYDLRAASDAAMTVPVGESMTVQSMSEDADINILMARFGVTGRMPDNPRLPVYGDFSGVRDYQSAWQSVVDAQNAFMELPANVRARFQNDPQQLLEFVANGANLKEAQALGLIKESQDGRGRVSEVVAPVAAASGDGSGGHGAQGGSGGSPAVPAQAGAGGQPVQHAGSGGNTGR